MATYNANLSYKPHNILPVEQAVDYLGVSVNREMKFSLYIVIIIMIIIITVNLYSAFL